MTLPVTNAQSNSPAQMIAIASGKGGVGKTHIAASLACCLGQIGQNVLLVDADFSLGNLDILLNVHPRFNIGNVLTGQKNLEDIVEPGPCGIDIIAGSSGIERLANLDERQRHRLDRELHQLRERYDSVLLDGGAGIAKSVVDFCLRADQAMIVVTPEATSITDAYSFIKILVRNGYEGQMNIIVNMADNLRQGKTVYHRLASVTSQFLTQRIFCAAVLVRDECLRMAVAQRQPVVLAHPQAPTSQALTALAQRLGRSYGSATVKRQPIFRKVVNWFS
jgi:flagellar biosynthesis protein FlhG